MMYVCVCGVACCLRVLVVLVGSGVRYIVINGALNQCLHIADVRALLSDSGVDVIRGAASQSVVASQSSTFVGDGNVDASQAIDSSLDTFSETKCVADDPSPWLQIDLGAEYPVQQVSITNRRNCCQGRLQGATIIFKNSQQQILATSAPLTDHITQTVTLGTEKTHTHATTSNIKQHTVRLMQVNRFVLPNIF